MPPVNVRRHALEAATLVLAAVLCALVANALASRERKLALPGSYANATKTNSSASLSPGGATAAPADSGATAPSVFPSKVNGAEATAPPTPTGDGGAAASAKSPFEEKRPGPNEKSAPKATPFKAGSEASVSSSAADLLKRFPPHNKPYVEISGDDVAWLFAHGALVLDARRTKDYEQGHIAGARSFPVWESDIDARVTALVGEGRDGAIPVVLYCSGGDCEDSHMLAQKLFGGGFNNLLVYRDGWPDWQTRGGKSARGPES
jgi:rhodanese-related sulfurtransferase